MNWDSCNCRRWQTKVTKNIPWHLRSQSVYGPVLDICNCRNRMEHYLKTWPSACCHTCFPEPFLLPTKTNMTYSIASACYRKILNNRTHFIFLWHIFTTVTVFLQTHGLLFWDMRHFGTILWWISGNHCSYALHNITHSAENLVENQYYVHF